MSQTKLHDNRIKHLIQSEAKLRLSLGRQLSWAAREHAALEELVAQRVEAMRSTVDEQVLVRKSQGARVEVYHRSDSPCRRVTRKGFPSILESEAIARGLSLCQACANRSFAPIPPRPVA